MKQDERITLLMGWIGPKSGQKALPMITGLKERLKEINLEKRMLKHLKMTLVI